MALITCPECGGSVSSFAKTCPHCGNPMNVGAAQPQPVSHQTTNIPQTPSPTAISSSKMGGVVMILLGLVAVILLSVVRSQYGSSSSLDMFKATFGFVMSFACLYFLLQCFKPGNAVRQFWALCCFGLGLFVEIVYLILLDGGRVDRAIIENYDYVSIAYGCAILLFAGTQRDWGKYIIMAAGVMWVVMISYTGDNAARVVYGISDVAKIIIGVVGGISLVTMFVGWLTEASKMTNHPYVRLISVVESMLVIATIVWTAIVAHTILDGRYEPVKALMIFMLVTGMSSLLFSLTFHRNQVIYFATAVFVTISMFLMLGFYLYYHGAEWYQLRDIYFTAMFLLPISIMMSYVAQLTSGITSRISIKVQ